MLKALVDGSVTTDDGSWFQIGIVLLKKAMPAYVCPSCDHSIVLREPFPGLHGWCARWYIMAWYFGLVCQMVYNGLVLRWRLAGG